MYAFASDTVRSQQSMSSARIWSTQTAKFRVHKVGQRGEASHHSGMFFIAKISGFWIGDKVIWTRDGAPNWRRLCSEARSSVLGKWIACVQDKHAVQVSTFCADFRNFFSKCSWQDSCRRRSYVPMRWSNSGCHCQNMNTFDVLVLKFWGVFQKT